MRQVILRLAVAVLAFAVGVAAFFVWNGFGLLPAKNTSLNALPRSTRLSLHLSASNNSLRVGEEPKVQVVITNNDSGTVTLVHPGDGSESGWRTPIISWSVTNAKEKVPITDERGLRCIYQDALHSGEVFSLAPGATEQLRGVYLPPFSKPGVYRVVFHYENRPSAEWKGVAMGTHDPVAMRHVRSSTESKVSSNELTFTVSE